MESLVYENFSVDWVVLSFGAAAVDPAELPDRGAVCDGGGWRDGADSG